MASWLRTLGSVFRVAQSGKSGILCFLVFKHKNMGLNEQDDCAVDVDVAKVKCVKLCDQIVAGISDGSMDPRFFIPLFCRKGLYKSNVSLFDPNADKGQVALSIGKKLHDAVTREELYYHDISPVVNAWRKGEDPLQSDSHIGSVARSFAPNFKSGPEALTQLVRAQLGIPEDYEFPFPPTK